MFLPAGLNNSATRGILECVQGGKERSIFHNSHSLTLMHLDVYICKSFCLERGGLKSGRKKDPAGKRGNLPYSSEGSQIMGRSDFHMQASFSNSFFRISGSVVNAMLMTNLAENRILCFGHFLKDVRHV